MEARRIIAAQEPSKRIAVFLDGTWNVQSNNTNVWRLYSLCAPSAHDGQRQSAFYTKGVGTAFGQQIRGGVLGAGINDLITGAYEWLISHYDDDDEVFIFGFSRGAFAARSLAGMVARCGILRPGSPVGVGELFERYIKGGQSLTLYQLLDAMQKGEGQPKTLLDRWMVDYARPAKIKMVGVWDTVGALKAYHGVLDTGLRLSIENAFHALAIDEHRRNFAPTLWTRNYRPPGLSLEQPRDRDLASVEQRWFVGAHANVGGGYASDLLPQIPLQWLMKKAATLGLAFRENVREDEAVYRAPVVDSFRQFARGSYYVAMLGRPFYRQIGEPPKESAGIRTTTVNETVDETVFERWRRDVGYRPANLTEWARRLHVDPGATSGTVMASDGRTVVPETSSEPAVGSGVSAKA